MYQARNSPLTRPRFQPLSDPATYLLIMPTWPLVCEVLIHAVAMSGKALKRVSSVTATKSLVPSNWRAVPAPTGGTPNTSIEPSTTRLVTHRNPGPSGGNEIELNEPA